MKFDDLYPAIFRRKSVRKYKPNPLSEVSLEEIRKYIENLDPMHEEIKTSYKIISPEQVRVFGGKAPHYIAALSESKEGYLPNVGYTLQALDLILNSNEIGSCWLGIPRPTSEVTLDTDLKFVILLSFGEPAEAPHRNSVSEYNRKPVDAISRVSGADELMEAARLSPSAMNNQGWFFTGDSSLIHAYKSKTSIVRDLFSGGYSQIDVGIACRHITVAAKHFGRRTSFTFDSQLDRNPPEGCEYIASIRLD